MDRRQSRREDPLTDVINWLDEADLHEEWVDGIQGFCGGESLGGVRELFAETPNEGTAASLGAMRDRSAGLRHVPLSRATRLPPPEPPPPLPANAILTDSSYCCNSRAGKTKSFLAFDNTENEDEEWDTRLKQTGAAGRLIVYERGDRPQEDFLLRGGGLGRRIMVASVVEQGKAAKSGVKAGDVLVSINGKKDFLGQSADFVHANLSAPVMLVFMGFVGKLQAEVRLNYTVPLAGVPPQAQVVRMQGSASPRIQVVDEVVFQPSTTAPLLLVMKSESSPIAKEDDATPNLNTSSTSIDLDSFEPPTPRPSNDALGSGEHVFGDQSGEHGIALAFQTPLQSRENTVATRESTVNSSFMNVDEGSQPLSVYELRIPEAKTLVQRALSRVKAKAALEDRFKSAAMMAPKVLSNTTCGSEECDTAQPIRPAFSHTSRVGFNAGKIFNRPNGLKTSLESFPNEVGQSDREDPLDERRPLPLQEHHALVHSIDYEAPAGPDMSLEMAEVPTEFDTFVGEAHQQEHALPSSEVDTSKNAHDDEDLLTFSPMTEFSPMRIDMKLPGARLSGESRQELRPLQDGYSPLETRSSIDQESIGNIPFLSRPRQSSNPCSLFESNVSSIDAVVGEESGIDMKASGSVPTQTPSQSRMSSRRCEARKNPERDGMDLITLCEV